MTGADKSRLQCDHSKPLLRLRYPVSPSISALPVSDSVEAKKPYVSMQICKGNRMKVNLRNVTLLSEKIR